ncbi:MAG: phosphate ABC transporter substrate-binding protein [Candidatus Desulfofervidus auxilii]|nr:phosphate ABC transporter substrate-binding protein [Candidatus Desulfofervidus auxilii]
MKRFLSIFLILFIAQISLAGEIVIKGSTTVLPIVQAVAEVFMKQHPEIKISVSGGGSGNGIKALIDGTCDIADSSRFIKQKEIKMAIAKGVYPVPHRIALDGVVPIVHPSNPIENLTLAQLHDIYTGKIKNWKKVGGFDHNIVVVSRDTSSGTYEVWREKVMKKDRVTPRALLQASNGAVIQTVAHNKWAIGYVGIGYLNKQVKAIKVEGVMPTKDTIRIGKFPITRPLFMFTNGWPEGEIATFINFVLSPIGQRIVEKTGYVAIYPVQ